MKPLHFVLIAFVCLHSIVSRAADQYFAGDGSALNTTKWGAAASGPFASAFTANNTAVFAITNGTGRGATIRVAGFVANENFTITAAGGTITNLADSVVPITVAAGKTLDFGTQTFTSAQYAGYIKNGSGVLALSGGDYGGGFTLNEGTVVMRNTDALGTSFTNLSSTLTINGGILASTATRDLYLRYMGGFFIGGDFQLGATTGLASASAGLSFSAQVLLGNAPRTVTLGNDGIFAFSGTISSSGAAGLTFASTPGAGGRFEITGTNTFTGPITITGGEVRFVSDAGLGNGANAVILDGGRLATSSTGNLNIASTRAVAVGDAIGTAINVPGGSATLCYDGAIINKAGEIGSLTKQGPGTLILGGSSSYSGNTTVQGGTMRITTRQALPAATTLFLGASGTSSLGTFDLNGNEQELAGLASIPGTNNGSGKNVITSSTATTLVLGGTGIYAFGAGTNANSGVISGPIALVKNGTGTQTLGDSNSYSGGTTINNGCLAISGNGSLGTGSVTITSGTLDLTGIASSTFTFGSSQSIAGEGTVEATGKTVMVSGTLCPGNGVGTLTVRGNLTLASTAVVELALGNANVGSYDRIDGVQDFTLACMINVSLNGDFTPILGDRFDLFDWSKSLYSPGFVISSNLNLPQLPGDLHWDTDRFLVDGSVLVIPEPSAAVMILIGASLLAVRRRTSVITS